jgi:hypothetical protein
MLRDARAWREENDPDASPAEWREQAWNASAVARAFKISPDYVRHAAAALAAAASGPPMTDAEVAAQRESWVRGEMGMAEADRADGAETRAKQ